ncbi:MAG: alpha/beta fold hydrolase [Pseudomonadota bacterium]|nr:alpha/beta fold hydrolase [Pseudomonadota bacterium]
MPRFDANGPSLNYVIDGPDRAPWVTFITGITNDTSMWDDQVTSLSKDFRLLRLDTRGHGGSGATPPPYTFDQLTTDVIRVWDFLGIKQSHVVGIGLGGMTTVALALKAPRRVSAIVPTACRVKLVPEYQKIWPPMLKKSSESGIEAIASITADRWFPENFRALNPAKMQKILDMIRRTSIDGYHGCITALLSVNLYTHLPELRMPALFISGELDHLGGPANVMQDMARKVQNGQHLSIPKAGHICNIANPTAYNEVLANFFENF